MGLPHTLEETTRQLEQDLAAVEELSDSDVGPGDAARLLGWMQELQALRTDNRTALENAVCALQRMQQAAQKKKWSWRRQYQYSQISMLIGELHGIVNQLDKED